MTDERGALAAVRLLRGVAATVVVRLDPDAPGNAWARDQLRKALHATLRVERGLRREDRRRRRPAVAWGEAAE